MRPLLLLAALAAAAGGCAGSEPAATAGPDAAPSPRLLAATADSLASSASPAARRALAERLLARFGVTPFADMGRQRAANPRYSVEAGGVRARGRLVGGLVPGRHPTARPELVVVGTALDGPDVGPVLEAARVLAERSQWVPAPERTVMVALWTGPDGARDAVRSGVWPRGDVRAVLAVGGAAPGVAVDSVRVVPLAPPAGPRTPAQDAALAQRIVDEALRLARRAAPADTIPPTAP